MGPGLGFRGMTTVVDLFDLVIIAQIEHSDGHNVPEAYKL